MTMLPLKLMENWSVFSDLTSVSALQGVLNSSKCRCVSQSRYLLTTVRT